MKLRQLKASERRYIREAIREGKRELGDHRRWWWMATLPMQVEDTVLGTCTLYFNTKYGRCYIPAKFNRQESDGKIS